MLVFNHDFDCFCIGDNKPRCVSRSHCMLNHVETNFKDAKYRQVQSNIEMIKKDLTERMSKSPVDKSVFYNSSETTGSFKKFD